MCVLPSRCQRCWRRPLTSRRSNLVFSFKGRNLLDIRRAGAPREETGGEKWDGKTQLARLIARRGGNEGAYGGILHFFNKRRPCVKDGKWRQPLEAAGIAFDAKDFVVDWAAARNPL